MGVRFRQLRLVGVSVMMVAPTAVIGSGVLGTDVALASTLPNPCSMLAAAHAQSTIAHGRQVSVGKVKVSTSTPTYKSCSQVVGSVTVYLGVSSFLGGSGGVMVTSVTHPSGLGVGDELTVGKAMGSGGPVDVIDFHKHGVYVTIDANGATPSNLTSFARQVFKSLH